MRPKYKIIMVLVLLTLIGTSFVITQPVLAADASPQVLCYYDHSEAWCSWSALIWQLRFNQRDYYKCNDGGLSFNYNAIQIQP